MCGFVGLFDIRRKSDALRGQVLKMSKQIRHRGPDWSGIYCGTNTILAHERLSIVDPESGGQPLKSKDGKLILAVNGEIYNHRQLREQLAGEYEFLTGSDCEVILALYRKKGINFLEELNGLDSCCKTCWPMPFRRISRPDDSIAIEQVYLHSAG